jgi:dihydrofolate synthase/folylpolyglutamate synthase
VTDPLAYLSSLEQFGIKFGLDNISSIVERLGHPERTFRSIHIAGTNGKGSVTAMVDAALRAAGHRSARYTSPHLIDLRERFVIDGRPVDQETLIATVAHVRAAVEALQRDGRLPVQPTFFEVTTAVAFELFRRVAVDTAVLEVGLGGRLDATNVVQPVVTAITSIAFDHQMHLGPTLPDIAAEKAGIIKPGVPVVVSEMDGAAFDAIERVALERGAELVRAREGVSAEPVRSQANPASPVVRFRTPVRDYGEIALGLRGAHQIGNAVVALRILELLDAKGIAVPEEAAVVGLSRPEWPGRLDLRRSPDGREALLDAAHNPAGAAALASYLQVWSRERVPLVFAAMRDKDVDGMLRALLPAVSSIVVTRASNLRAAAPHALAERSRRIDPDMPVTIAATPAAALAAAWRTSPRIVVAGSIFVLGDVLKEIGDWGA